jgi:hypothetical protein
MSKCIQIIQNKPAFENDQRVKYIEQDYSLIVPGIYYPQVGLSQSFGDGVVRQKKAAYLFPAS